MAISFDVLTHPHIVHSPKKKPIILGESDGNFIWCAHPPTHSAFTKKKPIILGESEGNFIWCAHPPTHSAFTKKKPIILGESDGNFIWCAHPPTHSAFTKKKANNSRWIWWQFHFLSSKLSVWCSSTWPERSHPFWTEYNANHYVLTSRTPQQTEAQGTTNKYRPVLLDSSSRLTQSYHEKEAKITI